MWQLLGICISSHHESVIDPRLRILDGPIANLDLCCSARLVERLEVLRDYALVRLALVTQHLLPELVANPYDFAQWHLMRAVLERTAVHAYIQIQRSMSGGNAGQTAPPTFLINAPAGTGGAFAGSQDQLQSYTGNASAMQMQYPSVNETANMMPSAQLDPGALPSRSPYGPATATQSWRKFYGPNPFVATVHSTPAPQFGNEPLRSVDDLADLHPSRSSNAIMPPPPAPATLAKSTQDSKGPEAVPEDGSRREDSRSSFAPV